MLQIRSETEQLLCALPANAPADAHDLTDLVDDEIPLDRVSK
jgi:hypothetical protein